MIKTKIIEVDEINNYFTSAGFRPCETDNTARFARVLETSCATRFAREREWY
jgi:hypothetical protein